MKAAQVMVRCVLMAMLLAGGVRAQDEGITTDVVLETPTSELGLALVPVQLGELEAMLEPVLGELERSAFGLVEMIRVEERSEEAGRPEEVLQRMREARRAAAQRHAELVTRVTRLLDAIEAKGGDVSQGRMYVEVVEQIRSPVDVEVTAAENDESLLQRTLDGLVAEVQAMPSVHDREAPWTVTTEELRLELQPLQTEEIERRLGIWKAILEQQVRQRVRIDIALELLQSGNEAFNANVEADVRRQAIEQLAVRSQDQQVVVERIVERVEVILKMLQARGVDVASHRRYVVAATGQRLNLWNPTVLWSQIRSWATSPTGGLKVAGNIGKFLGVLLLFYILSRVLKRAVAAAVGRLNKVSSLLRDFLVQSVARLTLLIGLVAAISAAGVNMGWAIAIIGAAGLVIGLALQGTLSNFASGLLILFYRPFDVGDVVDAGGVSGKVEKLRLFTTTVLTFDNRVMHVPNNQIWNNVITNATDRKTRRVDLVFGVGYGDDLAKTQQVLEDIVGSHEKILSSPAPTIQVNELGDNSVNFVVRPWVKTADYWDVYWDLHRQVKNRFDAEGLNIPFPQRDMHLPGPIEVKLTGGESVSLPEVRTQLPGSKREGRPTGSKA